MLDMIIQPTRSPSGSTYRSDDRPTGRISTESPRSYTHCRLDTPLFTLAQFMGRSVTSGMFSFVSSQAVELEVPSPNRDDAWRVRSEKDGSSHAQALRHSA